MDNYIEQMRKARKADLYEFLVKNHPNECIMEGNSLRIKNNHSISIKRNYSGYKDFSTEETGNSIDFLVRHMNYSYSDAVAALTVEKNEIKQVSEASIQPIEQNPLSACFPEPFKGPYKHLFAYLEHHRYISRDTIQFLVDEKLLYQEAEHNNIVFANKDRDWGEIHGTYSFKEKSFHGMVSNSRYDGFWSFKPNGEDISVIYICEAAIDAISLYELNRIKNCKEKAEYVSIGGVSKQPAIDRIKEKGIHTVIAVDNDDAGSKCRIKNFELSSIIPCQNDWNDDLRELKK